MQISFQFDEFLRKIYDTLFHYFHALQIVGQFLQSVRNIKWLFSNQDGQSLNQIS